MTKISAKTAAIFAADQAAFAATVVATIMGKPVTQGELRAAFELVENKANWKYPLDCTVSVANDREMEVIRAAVMFFTGSEATFAFKAPNRYRVQAIGYYAAVGA